MAASTLVTGIFQGDLIIRTAVLKSLEEIRKNPTLIDDALASLPQDELTAGRYGDKTVQECRDWFLNTKVDVRLGLQLGQLKSPQISIELNDTSEAEATLGDVNYEPSETDPYAVDVQGRQLASVQDRMSYNVVVMVQGEPELMLFLWTLTLFGLLRNKETLLDARGFNRLSFSNGVAGMLDLNTRENFFTRAIRLNGFGRHCWPAGITPDHTLEDGSQPRGVIEDVPVQARPSSQIDREPPADEGWGFNP